MLDVKYSSPKIKFVSPCITQILKTRPEVGAPMKYYVINSRSDFADLLSCGFGYDKPNPWESYDKMQKYPNPCIDLSWAKWIGFGPEEYYTNKGFTKGTIDDVRDSIKKTRAASRF